MKFKTDKDLDAFVAKVKTCKTWEELAALTHKSAHDVRFAVYNIRTKYGAEFCPLLEQRKRMDRKAKAVELRTDTTLNGGKGMPAKDIARRLRVSTATVCEWLAEVLGENWMDQVPQHVATEDDLRTKRIMSLRGKISGAEIGRREKISRQRVQQIVEREMKRRGMSGPPFPRGHQYAEERA